MNSTVRCRFSCRMLLLPSLVLTLATVNAQARVIDVGPNQAVKTIDAALARAAIGDEIVLERDVEHPTAGLRVTIDAIEIRSAEGSGAVAVIRNTSTAQWPITIEHRAEGLLLKDLTFTGSGNVTCVRGRGRRLTLDNVAPAKSMWRFVQLMGAQQTVIRHCDTPLLRNYTVCAFDADTRGLVIERCTFAGGGEEHTVRLHRIYGARLRDCVMHANGNKSVLSIREGADNRVENCTLNGRLYIGPLADGDGGINHPTTTAADRAKREALLRRSQKNCTFKNCTFNTDGITVEMGVADLTFDACRIETKRLWALRLNKDEYAPWRNVPTGRVEDCEIIGPPGVAVFERVRPGFGVYATRVNGVPVADTAVADTAAPDTAAVPATGATTRPVEPGSAGPAPAPAADAERPQDVAAAADHVAAAIDQLQAARQRLRSATQPAAAL